MWMMVTAALAQEPVSPEQAELYIEANTAYDEARYEDSLRLLDEAERYGSRNLIHLARGRVFHRLDQCEEAEQQYVLALNTPPVPDPPPEEVSRRAEKYRADLRKRCPATLEVQCLPPRAVLTVDAAQQPCGLMTLPPGTHQLELSLGRASITQTLELHGLERQTVEMKLGASAGRPLAIAALSAGVVMLTTGALLDGVWLGPAQDRQDAAALGGNPLAPVYRKDAQLLRGFALGGYSSGLVLMGVGVVGVLPRRAHSSSVPSSE